MGCPKGYQNRLLNPTKARQCLTNQRQGEPKMRMVCNGKTYVATPNAAQILCKSDKCLAAWRTRKIGPAYHRIGGRVMYDLDDIVDFINGSKVDPAA